MIPCTLRQLEVFIAAAEDCHFVRTANRLGISQPAVTSHILGLESQLGKQLFIRRRGSTPVLSTDGVALLQQARSFMTEGDKIRDFRRATRREKAVVRLCAGAHILEDYLKPNLGSFYGAHPDIMLECRQVDHSQSGAQMVSRGLAELMVLTVPDPAAYGLHAEVLRPVRFGLYGGPGFAGRRHATPVEIGHMPFILPLEGTQQDSLIQATLLKQGILCTRVAARAQYSDVILQMVKGGHGIAALFETMVQKEIETGEVVKLDVELPTLYRTLFRLPYTPPPAVATVETFVRDLLRH